MSVLIDRFKGNYDNINGKYYIARPEGKPKLSTRIKDAVNVITGKVIAVHFMRDIK